MSEHDFRAATSDTLRSEREIVDVIAEMLRDSIKAALKQNGQNLDRTPKIEIYSGPNKIHPAREGAKLTKDMVDNLTKSLAQNKEGSMRIFVELDGKREKIFHQTQGEVKTDTLGLQDEFKKKFGQAQESVPEQSDAQTSEQTAELSGVDALKSIYEQDKEAFARNFPATARKIDAQESDRSIIASVSNYDSIPKNRFEHDFLDAARKDGIEIPHPLTPLMDREGELQSKLDESRQSLFDALQNDAPLPQVDSALMEVMTHKILFQDNQNQIDQALNDFSASYSKNASLERFQDFVDLHNEQNPETVWQSISAQNIDQSEPKPESKVDVDAVLDAVDKAPEAEPTRDYPQSSDIPSLDHANEPTPAMTKEPESRKTEVVSEAQPDHLKFPTETQNQVQPIDPAMQAARAEFDRRLVQLEKSMNQMQSQVETFSQKFAPLINDPNLKSWAESGSQRHKQAMEPVRQQMESIKDRFKQVGQKLDAIGQGVVNRVAEAQAKAIDWGVTKLVNSRYGQDNDRGGRIFEGKEHTFRKIGNNTIISRNSDKAEVYKNGAYTKKANRVDKGAIAALPEKVKKLSQNINQGQTKAKPLARSR